MGSCRFDDAALFCIKLQLGKIFIKLLSELIYK